MCVMVHVLPGEREGGEEQAGAYKRNVSVYMRKSAIYMPKNRKYSPSRMVPAE
ncbi:hypothetical protein [Salibacterium halotolerans]|uniref:hypothetical protein n=1 Tax=Salibacterium halotolerans TaxID=1884432 RepID=UPI001BAFE407|nr:hypothetical protein [Salibacterium halotolerans]